MKIITLAIACITPGLMLTAIFWLGGFAFERGTAAACLAAASVVLGLAVLNAVVDWEWEDT
tara:strand:+ start:306 stop:488 length:183 start_codon:yes stop_codon:yes gene_type:complete